LPSFFVRDAQIIIETEKVFPVLASYQLVDSLECAFAAIFRGFLIIIIVIVIVIVIIIITIITIIIIITIIMTIIIITGCGYQILCASYSFIAFYVIGKS
jgi:hypothetical protein